MSHYNFNSIVTLSFLIVLGACDGPLTTYSSLYGAPAAAQSSASAAEATSASQDCTIESEPVLSGGSVEAFQNGSVKFGESCVSEIRDCSQGVLSGSYAFSKCEVAPESDCVFNNQIIANGSFVVAFESQFVGSGNACHFETRTCTDGILSGSFALPQCGAM